MKKLISNIFFFLFAFLITAFALDRFILVSYIENTSPTDFTKEYGRCRVKNKTFVYFNEGFGIGKFNKGRYIGNYYSVEKPKNVIRIAVLGDSYVEGFQVFQRNHFLTLLEKDLNKNYPDSFQVMNFGRSGFDFGDIYSYYERIVKQYSPDIVLLFVSNEDLDIRQSDVLIPRVEKDSSGNIIVTNNEMPKSYLNIYLSQKRLAQNSTVYQMLNNSRKLIKAGMLVHKLLDKFAGGIKQVESGENHNDKVEIKVSQLSYDLLKKISNEKGKFYIVNRGNDELSRSFVNSIPSSISYIDLFSDSDLYKNNNDPHFWKATGKRGHWNNEGHEIVFRELYNQIIN